MERLFDGLPKTFFSKKQTLIFLFRLHHKNFHPLPELLPVHLLTRSYILMVLSNLTIWCLWRCWFPNEVFWVKIKFDLVVIIRRKYYYLPHDPEKVSPD